MALVVFLRGVNVGGHKTFRPSVLAKELPEFDVVSIGTAGTFVVRKTVSPAEFRAELIEKLGFETNIVVCDGSDVLALERRSPFAGEAALPDVVRFVSIFEKAGGPKPRIPFALPSEEDWLVKVIAAKGRFVFGRYRRHMRTIGYLGRLDRLFGACATTRNWNTIAAILAVLKGAKSDTGHKGTAKRRTKLSKD